MNNNIIKNSDINGNNSIRDLHKLSKVIIPAITLLQFPFLLKNDQIEAVEAWINNNYRGTILYSPGTGKTEIAFECARRLVIYYSSLDTNFSEDIKSNADDSLTPITQISFTSPSTISKDTKASGIKKNFSNTKGTKLSRSFFNILFLVPRISLIDQTIKRLISYGIPEEKVGAYFGERKEIREIMISTYHSVVRNLHS